MKSTKVKINLNSGEIEFEGSQEFVQEQMDNLELILNLISSRKLTSANNSQTFSEEDDDFEDEASEDGEDSDSTPSEADLSIPESFGEWMHKFKDGINGVDKALITAYYVQQQAPKNDFKTIEVNNSLKDHGIKLSNPSKTLKSLETKKYLFQTANSCAPPFSIMSFLLPPCSKLRESGVSGPMLII